MNNRIRVSTLISIASWASIFAMFWLMILGVLPKTSISNWGFVGMFGLLALMSAAQSMESKS